MDSLKTGGKADADCKFSFDERFYAAATHAVVSEGGCVKGIQIRQAGNELEDRGKGVFALEDHSVGASVLDERGLVVSQNVDNRAALCCQDCLLPLEPADDALRRLGPPSDWQEGAEWPPSFVTEGAPRPVVWWCPNSSCSASFCSPHCMERAAARWHSPICDAAARDTAAGRAPRMRFGREGLAKCVSVRKLDSRQLMRALDNGDGDADIPEEVLEEKLSRVDLYLSTNWESPSVDFSDVFGTVLVVYGSLCTWLRDEIAAEGGGVAAVDRVLGDIGEDGRMREGAERFGPAVLRLVNAPLEAITLEYLTCGSDEDAEVEDEDASHGKDCSRAAAAADDGDDEGGSVEEDEDEDASGRPVGELVADGVQRMRGIMGGWSGFPKELGSTEAAPQPAAWFTDAFFSRMLGMVLLNTQDRSVEGSLATFATGYVERAVELATELHDSKKKTDPNRKGRDEDSDSVDSFDVDAAANAALSTMGLEREGARSAESVSNISGMGMYTLHANINHSCRPNCEIYCVTDGREPLRVSVKKPIKAGDEITISYIDETQSRFKRRRELKQHYLFACACPRCEEEKPGSVSKKQGGKKAKA